MKVIRNQSWFLLVVAVLIVGLVGVVERVVRSRHHCDTVIKRLGRMEAGSTKSSVLLMIMLRSSYLSGGQILKARAQVGSLEKLWTCGWEGLFVLVEALVVGVFVVSVYVGH